MRPFKQLTSGKTHSSRWLHTRRIQQRQTKSTGAWELVLRSLRSFDKLVNHDHFAITITSSWGASLVKEIPNRGTWDKASNYYWSTTIPSLARKLSKGDWVFLINDMAGFSPKEPSNKSKEDITALKSGIQHFSSELFRKGIHVAVLHGNPFAREANCKPLNASKQWFNRFSNKCILPGRKESLLRRKPLDDALSDLQRQNFVKVIDLFDIFCPQDHCTYNAKNGDILYRDEFSHPSVEAARLSSEVIRNSFLHHQFGRPSRKDSSPEES